MAQQAISTGTFCEAKWLVDPVVSQGTHTTIGAALTSASSGDTIFIRPGTYTENLTLKAGVNLAAFDCDAETPNVIIIGKCTLTTAGTVSISGIRLQTNSDFLLAVTGSAASIVNLRNCYLNCSNSSGISFTSSSGSSKINIFSCKGDLGTTAINYITHSGSGTLTIDIGYFTNSGTSASASTLSGAGIWQMYHTYFHNVITSSSTANGFTFMKCIFDCGAENTAVITHGCTNATGSSVIDCWIGSGSASAISVSASCALFLTNTTIQSSNTNAITGSGTITFSNVVFSGTSSLMNTTTQTALYTNLGKHKASGQPCFFAFSNTAVTNKTGDGTGYIIIFGTERFDQDNNFDGTSTFTAPVTGKYLFTCNCCVQNLVATSTLFLYLGIAGTSAFTYPFVNTSYTNAVAGNGFITGSTIVNMTAGDTAQVTVAVGGGAKSVGVFGGAADGRTSFAGMLVA